MKSYIFKSKANVALFTLTTIVISIFIVSALLQNRGTFTIMTPRDDMIMYGLVLSDNPKFDRPRAELRARAVKNMWNITQSDLPFNVDEVDGDHNGDNYLAYTFYVKNMGNATVNYGAAIDISEMHLPIDAAMRVKIYLNGKSTVYAKPKSDGSGKPEPDTLPFVAKTRIIKLDRRNLEINKVDKYTIVIWLEGEDPECVNGILGGSVKMLMRFDAAAHKVKKV